MYFLIVMPLHVNFYIKKMIFRNVINHPIFFKYVNFVVKNFDFYQVSTKVLTSKHLKLFYILNSF